MNNNLQVEQRKLDVFVTGPDFLHEAHQYDPDYIDDMLDPLRAAKGLLRGFLLGLPFWGLVCGLLALVNKYIGGG